MPPQRMEMALCGRLSYTCRGPAKARSSCESRTLFCSALHLMLSMLLLKLLEYIPQSLIVLFLGLYIHLDTLLLIQIYHQLHQIN